jgi:hypothetical protein
MLDGILGAFLEGAIGGYVGERLSRLIRPRKESEFDAIGFDSLKRRNAWVELAAVCAFALCLVLNWILLLRMSAHRSIWSAIFLLCTPITLFLVVISALTLPFGLARAREFWRYHELKHRSRLGFLLTIYIAFAIPGFISVYFVFWR